MTGDNDRDFFRAEVERLMDRLYGTALRLTRNPADAEDLVSEAVTKAWANLGHLADRQAFQKWLFRILTNTFVSDRRRARSETSETIIGADGEETFSLFEKLHQPFLLWWSNSQRNTGPSSSWWRSMASPMRKWLRYSAFRLELCVHA